MFDSIFLKLQNIHRFSNQGLSVIDTDADHTIRMQLMALELYKETKAFDPEVTSFKILCHDLDEICMCDIPRDVKYFDEKIHSEIERVSEQLMDNVGIDSEIRGYISSSKDNTTEGWIVKVLDVVDAFKTLVDQAWSQRSRSLLTQTEVSLGYLKSITSSRPSYVPLSVYAAVIDVFNECKSRYEEVQESAFK